MWYNAFIRSGDEMLRTHEQTQLESKEDNEYNKLYDMLVPKDNKYRIINDNVDFSFVYELLKDKYCLDNGRDAISPIVLLKYLIVKDFEHLSDEDVVKHSLYDLSIKYFLGMKVDETTLINPSTLTKFRKLRLEGSDLLNSLLKISTQLGIKKGLINTKTLIVDSTHTQAKYNSISPRGMLIERTKELRKLVYAFDGVDMKDKFPKKKEKSGLLEDQMSYSKELIEIINKDDRFINNEKVQEKINYLQEGINDISERIELSYDEDARTGHKTADTNFFGYKTHLGVSDNGIAVAAVMTSGEKTDGAYLEELVNSSNESGMNVEEVIGDKAYSSKDNIDLMNKKDIKVISRLSSSVTHGNRDKNHGFEFNKDAQMYQCPLGHLALSKRKTGGKRDKSMTYYFDIEKCKVCPNKEQCKIKDKQQTKTFSIKLKEPTHLKQMEFEQTEEFQTKIKGRYVVEQSNAILKSSHDYNVARSKGLNGLEIQGAIALFCMNMKKILYPYSSQNKVNEKTENNI